jgi:hypothetical protein
MSKSEWNDKLLQSRGSFFVYQVTGWKAADKGWTKDVVSITVNVSVEGATS